MSAILGLEALEQRMQSLQTSMDREVGAMLEEQALTTQRDLVNMLPHHTGRAIEAMSSPDAVKVVRDKEGNVTHVEIGLLTLENRRKAFHLLFLEKGRQAYKAGQFRFAGMDKRYAAAEQRKPGRDARKFKKMKRSVGAMAPRQYFRIAFTLMSERMKTARGIGRLKGFIKDNFRHL